MGYILGIRIATVMVAGSALSALVIVPAIYLWGMDFSTPFYPETEHLIRNMSSGALRDRYVRYIGAGAVASGGIITLIRSIPTMVESFKLGLGQLQTGAAAALKRTDRDLSFRTVLLILFRILVVLAGVPGILGYIDSIVVRGLAALLIAIFAFFFVTVSSRIVGLVGMTSNPTSGMTIATLLATSAIFWAAGWTDTGQGDRADGRHRGLHRRLDRRRHFAGSQDRLRAGGHAAAAADRRVDRRRHLGRCRLLRDPDAAPQR